MSAERTAFRIITAASLLGSAITGCNAVDGGREKKSLSPTVPRVALATDIAYTPTLTRTPRPTRTPTMTSTPTRTPTPTVTPNFEATNVYKMETSLKGETVELTNLGINNILVLEPVTGGTYVFGLDTDAGGKTERIFENFDCQFDVVRDEGLLQDQVEVPWGPINLLAGVDKWNVDLMLDEITAERSSGMGDVEMFTSKSFVLNGKPYACEEYSTRERLSDKTRDLIQKVLEFTDRFR